MGIEEGAPTQLGPYDLQQELARGPHGVIYLGTDPERRRTVAVKRLFCDRTKMGATRTAVMHYHEVVRPLLYVVHRALSDVYQYGEFYGDFFVAREYLEMPSLAEVVAKRGPMTVPQALRVGRSVAEALGPGHARRCPHLGIKPTNLFLKEGVLRVADYGHAALADLLYPENARRQATVSPFAAPEQSLGPGDLSADVFSVGALICWGVQGAPPRPIAEQPPPPSEAARFQFLEMDQRAAASPPAEQMPESAVDLPPVPEPARRLLGGCLARDPQERYPDAQSLLTALEQTERALVGDPQDVRT